MKKFLLCFIIILIIHEFSYAQCEVTAQAHPTVICAGEQVILTSSGGCGYLMSNDFNNGTPGPGWQATTGVNFTNPCGPGPDLIYLWMGRQVPIPRTLTTIPFDVQGGCQVRFYMRYAIQTGNTGTDCEGPDEIDEGISLQYSTNGGSTWTDIVYFRPDGVQLPAYPGSSSTSVVSNGQQTPFTTWAQYSYNVPAAAQSPNTMFRWRQHAYTDMDYDHWGLDVVEIICPTGTAVVWHHGPTVFNPPPVYPTSDTCYIVTVIDTLYLGSTASDTVCIQVKSIPSATFQVTSPICSDQSATIQYTGNAPPPPAAQYNWYFSGGTVISGSGQGPFQVTWPFQGWQYVSLMVTHDGCNSPVHFDSVFVNLAPTAVFNATPKKGCMPLNVQFTNLSTGNPAQFIWNFGDGHTSNEENPSHTYTIPGSYPVGLIVVTQEGCDDTLIVPNYIEVYPQPIAHLLVHPELTYVNNPVFYFDADTTYVTNWFWNFGDGSSSILPPPLMHQYPPVEGQYEITLIVLNEKGCADTARTTVYVLDNELIFPNIITPGNNDGFNDYFVIHNVEKYPNNYLVVFNRWGKKVFEAKNYQNDWDGGDLAEGTYFYIFRYLDKEYQGTLTILREKK